jgi:hypothetical protein
MGRMVYQRDEKPIDPGALLIPAISYSSMSANLPLHEMSLEEKLQAMEALWEDLSREPDRIESPSWHQDLLKETESRVESGEATFSDWEKAKVSIRDRLK